MLRLTDEIAHDGIQFVIALKAHKPQELIADEKLLFKCMSKLVGQEINIRRVVALSHFR